MHPIWITFFILIEINFSYSSPAIHSSEVNDFKNLRKYVIQLENDVHELTSRLKNTEERLEVIEHSSCIKFCNVSGTVYMHGSNFTLGCDICICFHGKVNCHPKQCPVTKCKYPETQPGECCPKCKRKCYFEDQFYEHNEEIKRKHKTKCISCTCKDGVMKCDDVNPKCPKLNCPLNEQLLSEDGCCNFCPNTNFCKEGHNCDANASCHNLKTKFECNCNSGYKGNGTVCVDINECKRKGGLYGNFCNQNTKCENLLGSYKCECLSGFERKDSYSCNDIDECKKGTHNCGSNSTCVNLIGSYRCDCQPGYEFLNGECHLKCDNCCKRNAKLILNGKSIPINDDCSSCNCEHINSIASAQTSMANTATTENFRLVKFFVFFFCLFKLIVFKF